MKPRGDRQKSPFDFKPENVDEERLICLLEVLVAAGKATIGDIETAWRLVER